MLELALPIWDTRPAIRTIDWAREHGFTERGQPYNDFTYPHLGAPGGPFDAFDCPAIFDIWLQWASRLGKTFGGQVAMLKHAHCDPCPMMFAGADEKLVVEVADRTKKMVEFCPVLHHTGTRQDRIDFPLCRSVLAWARSVSSLADKSVRFGHANEIDKWEHQTTSKEADPLKLFDDRFKEFPTFKRWKESTPSTKDGSRIERGRIGSCNASYWVPCPHCLRYQTLQMGDGESPGGLRWDKPAGGKSDKEYARQTAWYACAYCEDRILDEHRGEMMRRGVWIPEGCGCDDAEALSAADTWREPGREAWQGWKESPWVTGNPLRDGREWGSRLSSLYALSLSWGANAAEFINSKDRPQDLRNFTNQWEAKTWAANYQRCTWEVLGERIIAKTVRGYVPAGFAFLTAGVDRQADHFVWVVDAWGEDRKSHTVDYGTCETFDQLQQSIITRNFPCEDANESLQVQLTLIDSGYHPKDIYFFCRDCTKKLNRITWPCKGSNTALGSPYKQGKLGDDTLMPGAPIMHVDTLTTQDLLQHQLTLDPRRDRGAMTVCYGAVFEHQDFLEQILNDGAVVKPGQNKVDREVWERIDGSTPNDYRDCRRYSWAAMLRVTRGAEIRPRVKK